ncbi:hypothetical protein MKEN_00546300 [Mycena kentingensis (nom. inval.)]|nr:hypothetical protein MKEN_00546300 [Mycena kentingensis (nom. inval.)]
MLNRSLLLTLVVASAAAGAQALVASPEGFAESLAKRQTFSGRTTWYPNDTGPDDCTGLTHLDSDIVVAMNLPQSGSCCGHSVHIIFNGRAATARCVDFCRTCPSVGQLDVTKGLFEFFADHLDVGVFTPTWSFVEE